jgi:TolA-binding protein
MRKRSATYRPTRIAATFVAAIACAQSGWSEDAPLTPLNAPPATATQPAAPMPTDAYEAAAAAFRDGKWSTAAEEFSGFIAEKAGDPRVEQARFFLAEALLRDGKHAAAAATFETVLQSATDPAIVTAAQFRCGEAAYLARDFDRAMKTLTKFLDAQPQHAAAPRAWHYLSEAAYATGRFDQAETACAYFTACYPDDAAAARVATLQTASLLQLGRVHEARTVLIPLQADSASADDPTLRVLAGSLQVAAADEALAVGDLKLAAGAFEQFAVDHPQHELAPYAAYRLAEIASAEGEWVSAAKMFAAVIERGDLDRELVPTAWLARVQALAQDRDWAAVLTVAAEAQTQLTDWPRNYEFDYLRGRAHLARAEMKDARVVFGQVIVAPNAKGTEVAALAQYMTAETHFLQRRYAEALVEYAKAGEHAHPHWQAAAQLQSGKCCEQLNRPADAQVAYETLLREFADSPFAAEARSRRDACLRQASAPAAAQRK